MVKAVHWPGATRRQGQAPWRACTGIALNQARLVPKKPPSVALGLS
jgi:hypothetical protein